MNLALAFHLSDEQKKNHDDEQEMKKHEHQKEQNWAGFRGLESVANQLAEAEETNTARENWLHCCCYHRSTFPHIVCLAHEFVVGNWEVEHCSSCQKSSSLSFLVVALILRCLKRELSEDLPLRLLCL